MQLRLEINFKCRLNLYQFESVEIQHSRYHPQSHFENLFSRIYLISNISRYKFGKEEVSMFNLFASKKKRVLIIDDDQDLLESYLKYFRLQNEYEVIGASSRAEFMKHINNCDAVVSDFHMADVTGISFEQVLEICIEKKIPCTLLTGDIYPYFDFQLGKPVNVKTMKINVEKMLANGFVMSKRLPPGLRKSKAPKAS